MSHFSSLQFALLAVLLAIAGYFFMLQSDTPVIEVNKNSNGNHDFFICGGSPWVKIDGQNRYWHADKSWQLQELLEHLVLEYHLFPYGSLNIQAEEAAHHETVVQLSDKLKQVLPDTQFVWGVYKEAK